MTSDEIKWEHEMSCLLCRFTYRLKLIGRTIYREFANSGLAMMGLPPVKYHD